MDRDLFLAILAMDSYNRTKVGSPVGIVMPTEGALGNAVLYLREEDLASNFFVQSYSWDNEIVVSYRGTDDDSFVDLNSDVYTGWITGGGAYMGPQAQRAAEFFNLITGDGQYTANVTLTGHSLGGGLAALLAAVHGIDAVVFDNMPFELAAGKAYDFSRTAVWDETGIPTVIDPAARALYYYGQEPSSAPNMSGVSAYATVGEILGLVRPAQGTPVVPLNPWLDPNQDDLGSTDLHSQALLVTLLYERSLTDHFWRETIAQTLIKQLFSDDVALAAGIMPPSAQDGTSSPAAKMLRMIGYSAIDEGERPFGDSGIRALFDDANQLGKPMLTWGDQGPLRELSEALTQIITQYAATLAYRDDESAARKQGVVTLGPGDTTLAVDLSDSTWEINDYATAEIFGRESLIRNLDVGGALAGVAWNAFGMLYGATSLDRIKRLGFQLAIDGQPVAVPESLPTSGPAPLTFFAGTTGGDVIQGQGTTADEIIYGGQGNDTIDGGQGKDLLIGGLGNDNLVGGENDDVLIGGEGSDTAEYKPSTSTIEGVIGDAHLAVDDARGLQITTSAYDTDTFFEIETIKLTDRPDALSVDDGALNIRTTIDMGLSGPANVITNVDVIDYSDISEGLNYFYGHVSTRTGTANSYGTQFSGIGEEMATIIDSRLRTGLHNKGLVIEGADKVILTAQNDALIGAARGSIIETGGGNDKIWVMPGVAITDLSSTDRLTLFGTLPLYGGLKSKYSESAYASWYGGLVKYGLNQQGDLIIRTSYMEDDDPGMFILNWKANAVADGGGDLGPGSIFLAEFDIGVYNLLDPDLPGGSVDSQLQFLCALLKILIGAEGVNDPLVLDLDGDGLELTTQTSVSPLFDVDGDLFAERTGWVRGDDGMLALDANANGAIDSVRELFGSPGASGFAELATYDSNSDGIINNLDAIFGDLRVWQDLDGDGVTDAGELKTLTELGIVSINVTGTAQTGVTNAGNAVLATGTFTRANGSTGTLADIGLSADQLRTEYLGDKSVSTAAAALPELKGRGTLTDLRVAMTLDPTLIATVQTALPALDTLDLASLRAAALPILAGWAQAVQLPDASGTLVTVPPAAHADLPVLVEYDDKGRPHVTDFAYQATDAQGSYWRLASNDPIRDANGDPIARPVYQDVLDQTGDWTLFTGAEIAFMERYTGVDLPIDTVASVPVGGLDAMSAIVDNLFTALNRLTIRLAIQGPLAAYFGGIEYDAAADNFRATTDRQLIPVYEAIFADAPATAQGAADYLADWKPLLDYLLGDFDRGADHLEVTYSYVFAAMVAAYESTGLALDITTAAGALGVPTDLIVTGTGTLTGANDADIFYMGAGDQVARGGIGLDAYVFGRNFGNDTIDDQEPEFGAKDPDIIRFADIKSDEVTATRVGLNLIITVIATGDTVTVLEQFEGRTPTLFGGDVSRDTGVREIVFADGVVWDAMDIAKAVSNPLASDDTLIGTPDVDVLDGGAGTDYLSGGSDTDLYRFGSGYGSDTIEENMANVLVDGFDIVQFGEGLELEDVTFRHVGATDNLEILINGTDDKLTVVGQFEATYTGPLGTVWLDRIEAFAFADGSYMAWDELMGQLVANAKTDGNDAIYGFSWGDTIDGGAGDDFLAGGNENDVYIFGLGYGNDTIDEQESNILGGETDRVKFGAGIDPTNVTLSRTGNSNDFQFVLSDGSTLTVQDQFDAAYTGVFGTVWFDRIEYFEFQDAANTVWTYETVMQRLIDAASTSGNDEIYGFSRNDVLDGGEGDDYLAGGNESDTYVFDVGYGQDQVYDAPTTILDENLDKVTFGPGITTQNIRLARSGPYDLIVSIDGQPDTLRVVNMFAADNLGNRMFEIETFHFADGTIWTPSIIQTKLLQGTSGNDTLIGFFSADTLDGGAGNDRLEGGDDGDTYVFDIGYGQDVILDQQSSIFYDSPDKVLLGPSITTQNIRLSRSGSDLIIGVDGYSDTLRIIADLAANNLGGRLEEVEELRFADGTIWTRSTIQTKLLQGTSGNDTLIGFFSADTLDGGAGNDRLEGGDAGDTYVFGLGYGRDTIKDVQTSIFADAPDKVQLGAGILPADVSVTRVAGSDDLVLSIAGTTDRLTILGYFYNYYRVEEVRFADGTVWNYATVVSKSLIATGGDDTIVGSSGADVLDGRAGNDNLQGAAGADRYLFGRGAGQDRITDSSGVFNENQVDVIEMAADVLPSDISVSRPAGTADLVLKINGTSDRVTIVGHFSSIYAKLEEVRFADGTVWNYQALMLMSYAGTAADESLYGTADNNTIDGGAGNDYMEAGTASDVYVFGRGYGQDRLWDDNGAFGSANIDAVQLGADILPQDVILRRTGAFDLTLFIAGTADRLTVQSFFGSTGYRIEEIRFANGTVWNLAAIYLNATTGTAGNDTLIGSGGTNTLDGGAGVDYLDGSDGSDIYKFGRGYGQDTLGDYDLNANTDAVVMAADVAPADVLVSRSGNNLVLRIAGTTDRLTITSQYFGTAYGIEEVRFNDGTVWNRATLTSMAAATTSGDDSIIGTSAANTLDGGADNDYLEGGTGADTYVFGLGYGQDRIYDLDSNTATIDAISFLAGVAPSDILVSRGGTNGVDLILRIAGTSDMLRVTDFFFNSARQIEEVRFNDGTVWTYATIVAKAAIGGAADESIYGTDSVETLTGAGGNDYIEGRKGNDIYSFSRGDGQDRLLDDDTTVGNVDTIQFGVGILPAEILVTRAGSANNDIVLIIAGTADRLTIIDGALNATRRVEQVQFADGTVWSYSTLVAMSHAGTAADQNLYGSDEVNAFNGGAGNDYQEGRKGNDTYAFGRDAGQDRINDTDTTVGNVDAIVLGGDVAVADVLLWRSGTNNNDLTIQINGTSDRITVSRQLESDTYRVEELRFADGTIWDATVIRAQSLIGSEWDNTIQGFASADTLLGNAGNDSLFGNDGADTLNGGSGDDLLDGGLGNDIYQFGRGSGFDRVDNAETDSATANDRVEFGATIAFDQLWLTQSGNDLLLNVIGGGDRIRIQNWYSNTAAKVDAFRTADGKELTETRVQALVSAMAAFAPPSGSDPSMPPDTRQQLDNALAAAWQPTT